MSTRDDVEEFAALLRRLKDRTDRSYGSLARRLNMNTSTLHRYCAGEAVPQDFAPVERLAAFCQAAPEERLELHRLWLAALEARQRVRTAGSTEAEVPAATPNTDEGPTGASDSTQPGGTPDPDGATGQPAGGPVPDGFTGQPGGIPAPEGSTVPESHPHAGDSAKQPGSAPHPDGSTEQRGGGSEPDETVPSPVRRPWYRRRRVLTTTAVTCALLATLGITTVLSDDRSPEAHATRSAVPRTTALGTPHHSAKPSAGVSPSLSPSPSHGSASPGPRQKAPALSATGSRSTSPEKPPTGLPLAWSADSQVWDMGCGHDYVIDKPPAQVPPPPVQQDAGTWAATQGAVHGRQTMVQISVQGRSSTAVVLEALRVRIVSRGNPAAGNAYAMDQGCGGELTPSRFAVNLDADRPIARPKDGADSEHTVPAVHFPYRVSAEDPQVLLVDATTQTYDARWYLELDWSSQGRTGTVRIDDHGRPFHTTSTRGIPRYWYGTNDTDERAWVPYGG
ncbi:helix-turn-helix domain-containing protein [Streptomyces sp. 5-8]|uniref:Helix-turn-helix domain-containing protein n=1 Tax=Streptomyces musisoli TaxID=2802280 RepID=A0ABS1NVV7_9ACTN|nr:helix-turn-helix transcriptional regulator [Streptomyces musisoli]MBL1104239.1 helix-turn-helix domain-containing protein [Streptomyces musisoli]